MDKVAVNRGFTTDPDATPRRVRCLPLWRPWTGTNRAVAHTAQSDPNLVKPSLQVVHPVKLFWPKSKCFDYLYQDAEWLLLHYPVQATICQYEESSSSGSEDSDLEDDEEEENKLEA